MRTQSRYLFDCRYRQTALKIRMWLSVEMTEDFVLCVSNALPECLCRVSPAFGLSRERSAQYRPNESSAAFIRNIILWMVCMCRVLSTAAVSGERYKASLTAVCERNVL